MAKITNNPIMKGASGMLAKAVVYRRFHDMIIILNRPAKRDRPTAHQAEMKSRFLKAVKYAKKQIANPEIRELYQPVIQSKFTSACAVALADCLTAPVIHSIHSTGYHGVERDEIWIHATDDFNVMSVHVSIFNLLGELLETGPAKQHDDVMDYYMYQTKNTNAFLTGTKIIITVRDRPGNTVTLEKIL